MPKVTETVAKTGTESRDETLALVKSTAKSSLSPTGPGVHSNPCWLVSSSTEISANKFITMFSIHFLNMPS